MLILLLKNHAYPCTCDWFITNFIPFVYTLVLCQNYTGILAHPNTRAWQHIAGCSYSQVLTEGSVFESQLLRGHCKGKKTWQNFLPAREFSRDRWRKKKALPKMPRECALWLAATYRHRDQPAAGPVPAPAAAPASFQSPGARLCLPGAKALCKAMHISESHCFI